MYTYTTGIKDICQGKVQQCQHKTSDMTEEALTRGRKLRQGYKKRSDT
jgi:hypothetical protein